MTDSLITIEHEDDRWLITIERGNAVVVWTLRLTDAEKAALGSLLNSPSMTSIQFRDFALNGNG